MIDFKEVYKLPLRIDEYCPIYVKTSNNIKAFNLLDTSEKYMNIVKKVINIINGDDSQHITNNVTYNEGFIFIDNSALFLVRGWGHLTGAGAMNLDPKIAAKIQDEFCEFIVKKLKGEL